MAKVDRLITQGEKIMLSVEETFTGDMRDIERLLMAEIMKLFDEIDVKQGKLQNSEQAMRFLASMDARIDAALKKSGYNSKVAALIRNFDKIRENNIAVHAALNNETIAFSSLNAITNIEVENTINKLLGAGISVDFKYPIREALYRNITLGASIQDAKSTIESYILSNDGKDSKLLRYVGQVARDSVNQYNGVIEKTIANELDLKDFIYVGTIITDSRCQCRYWVNKGKLKRDELIDEIQTAVDGRSLGGCKCSGMMPESNIDNFSVTRGGYNCTHRAIATNLK